MPTVPELPWLHATENPANALLITDPSVQLIDRDTGSITSDTQELRKDWNSGIYT